MKPNVNCGHLFSIALRKYAGTNVDSARLLYAGFVFGQAEKVYLGACRACMIGVTHPSIVEIVRHIVHDAADLYGLAVSQLNDELWLSRPTSIEWAMDRLRIVEEDSPEWHQIRASLCGVPLEEVDTKFHERTGSCSSV